MASSTLRVALCLASLLLVSHLASAQPTPTEMLNAQRQQQVQQQRVQQQQENQRRVATRRLPAPCVVPESYYPFRTCKVSSNPRECGKGWNAWASFADCCRPGNGGAFPQGCTNFNKQVECYIPCKLTYLCSIIKYIYPCTNIFNINSLLLLFAKRLSILNVSARPQPISPAAPSTGVNGLLRTNAALLDALSLKVALSLNHAGSVLIGSLSANAGLLTNALLAPAAGAPTLVSVNAALLALRLLTAVAMLTQQKLLPERMANF